MKKIIFILALFLLSTPVSAENYMKLEYGVFKPTGELKGIDGTVYGIGFGKELGNNLLVEGKISLTDTEDEISYDAAPFTGIMEEEYSIKTRGLEGNIRKFIGKDKIKIYGGLGLGIYQIKAVVDLTRHDIGIGAGPSVPLDEWSDSATLLAANVFLGVQADLTDKVFLFIEAKNTISQTLTMEDDVSLDETAPQVKTTLELDADYNANSFLLGLGYNF